jgi:hypothetical protein
MNRTRWIIVILVAFMAAGLFLSMNKIKDYYIKSKLDPAIELSESANNMKNITDYRYRLQSSFTVEERGEVISKVEGEKSNGNTHIKGEMVNTPVDIYYIDRTIYNYDSASQKWLVIESDTNNSEELLISELNPLSNFRLKQVNQVEKINFEMVDGVECLVVQCQPSVESQLLETLWKDFEYRFWLDYKQRFIRKASLNAVNKRSPGTTLSLTVEIFDIGENINIEPPDTSTKKN